MHNLTNTTAYPIYFIRGFAAADWRYWGRLPRYLAKQGYQIFFSTQDTWGDIYHNACYLAKELQALKKLSGAEKFHLFAHSKGGLDARLLISDFDGYRDIASLTTFGTPHRGISLIEDVAMWPSVIKLFFARAFNRVGKNQEDQMPDVAAALRDMSPKRMQHFNERVPNHPEVYYRSVAGVLENTNVEHTFMALSRKIYEQEGPNDGIVSVASALWGDHKEIWRRAGRYGVSHHDLCDYHKQDIRIHRSGYDDVAFDVFTLYEMLIQELEELYL